MKSDETRFASRIGLPLGLLAAMMLLGCNGSAHDVVQTGCTQDADCAGGRCVAALPGGLCTTNCTTQEECPDGTVCTDTEAHDGICLFSCATTDDCVADVGEGYVCDTETNLTTGADTFVCIDS